MWNGVPGGVRCASKTFYLNKLVLREFTLFFKTMCLHIKIGFNCITITFSKPAITDHLEIDQYMWAILDNLSTTDTEEVTIDASANWKALRPLNSTGIKVSYCPKTQKCSCINNVFNNILQTEDESDSKRFCKVMSPGSTALPTWDNSQLMNGATIKVNLLPYCKVRYVYLTVNLMYIDGR